ncbi:hypothetical protein [Stakelama tenebrarum]|uniref:Lipoprotein n=1 Tax=Stakelama tenebrarum TaxID=2711215 RepID=A0A6G6Y8Q7_9SPHN|nr:hypothetical protein [Sphingosinithalassobacter tenebrarum]QIG81231.1 hypothetical protein G5C33_16575 [Sphingosinithalassobacter tenebrarum]
MATYIRQRPPRWFSTIAYVATLWGALGCLLFLLYSEVPVSTVLAETMFFDGVPGWYTAVYAAAVASTLMGGVALITRSVLARALFLASLGLLAVQFGYALIDAHMLAAQGWSAMLLPTFLVVVAGVELWFAEYARKHGWIR